MFDLWWTILTCFQFKFYNAFTLKFQPQNIRCLRVTGYTQTEYILSIYWIYIYTYYAHIFDAAEAAAPPVAQTETAATTLDNNFAKKHQPEPAEIKHLKRLLQAVPSDHQHKVNLFSFLFISSSLIIVVSNWYHFLFYLFLSFFCLNYFTISFFATTRFGGWWR